MPDRLLLPVIQTEVRRPDGFTRRYQPGRDGTVTPVDAHDARALREAGAVTAGVRVGGHARVCGTCGFKALFVRCGRCGGVCTPEGG